jgi:hypothetical protein
MKFEKRNKSLFISLLAVKGDINKKLSSMPEIQS